MEISSQRKEAIVNRIKRFSLIVFIKKYIVFFILLAILALSLLFGLWNVREIEFSLQEDSNSKEVALNDSVEDIKGKNIFLLSPSEIEQRVVKENGFVKKIYVEKRIPFKIYIEVQEHIPAYIGYSSNRCVLFSQEGVHIKEICKDCLEGCMESVAEYSSVFVLSDATLESSKRLIFYSEFNDILKVLHIFGYDIASIEMVEGISRFKSSNENIFIFDLSNSLDIQLSRMYLVGQKINSENMVFKSLDLRFVRPVMRL
ncbi:MAG: FtsQ-type POTRA domain-containing protein [Candidatus Dojkabacteria bacterium]|jgi:hypothetical protein|nr:FtsQ-type POTRA domain-containing protein [Candidatus Dojkabacteria bacterium]